MLKKIKIERKTKETEISIILKLNGNGESKISTPIGFFNHMLEAFSKHSLIDIEITASGDLEVDQHHLIEDCGIILGQGFDKALGNRSGIARAGFFIFPMDESLSQAVVDFGGRSFFKFSGEFKRRFCGEFDLDLVEDFFSAFSLNSKSNIYLEILEGKSDHHKIESLFKAFGKAVKMALTPIKGMPSTKGVIG